MSIDWLPKTRREWFVWYCLQQRGLPYRWRGDDPIEGEDCSGFVIYNGQTPPVYLFPLGYDNTAAGIYAQWDKQKLSTPALVDTPGSVIFWSNFNDPAKIHHVEVYISQGLSIGAASGDHTTVNDDVAEKQGAMVKVRLCGDRGMIRFYADPFAGQG